ncbi:MAG: deoxyhypusine synthase [Methanobacteriaceae archaeon]|jgi:deoxyhypusine synthase|nr:deoxyhypusine synthase [Methanobacteriaceae archaeon]
MEIDQINIKKDMKISELIDEFESSGVLGSGRVSRSCNILADMLDDEEMNIFLSFAGPMVPGGLRNIISSMVKNNQVDLIITSGANITHDLLEAFGGRHYKNFHSSDEELNSEGIGRIGDVFTKSEDFEVFEKEITEVFKKIQKENKKISIQKLLYEVGLLIEDENSILYNASKNNIPIFAPGIIDSMLGLQLWMFTQDNEFVLDAVEDMSYLSDIVFESKKVGGIFLGGGIPKHYALASNILKGGIDAAIQITMDRPESGSLSGAPLEEAKSWSKAKCSSNLATVIGDVTIIFPLILAGALDKINK